MIGIPSARERGPVQANRDARFLASAPWLWAGCRCLVYLAARLKMPLEIRLCGIGPSFCFFSKVVPHTLNFLIRR
jgi:hypothetical protein